MNTQKSAISVFYTVLEYRLKDFVHINRAVMGPVIISHLKYMSYLKKTVQAHTHIHT